MQLVDDRVIDLVANQPIAVEISPSITVIAFFVSLGIAFFFSRNMLERQTL